MKKRWSILFALFLPCSAMATEMQMEPVTFTQADLGNQINCDCQDYQQWHHNLIHSREVWTTYTGIQSFKVGVISSGIDTAAFDLGGDYFGGGQHPHPNMWKNPGEVYDGLDNDGNGFVDDVRGYNFTDLSPGGIPPNVSDYWGTGTLMASVMAAEGPEMAYRGVGVAPNVTIVPVKWFSGLAGDAYKHVQALRYARNAGCKIILSLGGTNQVFQPIKDEIAANTAAGVLTIWASGGGTPGGNIDSCPEPCSLPGTMYPQKYDDPGLLVVTSCYLENWQGFQDGKVPTNVNWGPISVDLAAPTQNVNQPYINPSSLRYVMTVGIGEQWGSWQGTSTAAASMVAGAAALLWSHHPALTAAEVKAYLMSTVTALPGLSGKSVTGGMLNVAAAMAAADQGEGQIESAGGNTAAPAATGPKVNQDATRYDVQGRKIDPAIQSRSGVTFGAKKRAVVK